MKYIGIASILLLLVTPHAAASAICYVHLGAGRLHYDPARCIDYYRDVSGKKSIADVGRLDFKRLRRSTPDFGYTTDKFWLRFGVVNETGHERTWALRTFVRFMRPLEIYVSRNGATPRRILYNDQYSSFGHRPENIRHLAVEFTLAPHARDVFFIRFGAGGSATLPMEITTPRQMAAEQAHALLQDGLFVAVLATLTLFNLFHYFAVRARAYLFYGIQAMAIALYITHMDGFTFQYLWPNAPAWNSIASPVLGSSANFAALLFSIAFLRSRDYTPVYYRWLTALLWASGLTVALCFVLPSRITNQIGLTMIFVIALSLLPHAIYVVRHGHISARYYLLGWTFMLSGVSFFGARMLGLISDDGVAPLSILKVTILMESLSLALGLADQHRRLHIEHAKTQERLVETLEGRLAEAKERIQLEHERERTMRSLLRRTRQLAETSHDINQPIHSLRLAVNALSARINDPAMVETLDKTLAHMGDVLNAAISETGTDITSRDMPATSICAGQIMSEVAAGFTDEAAARGVQIRAFNSNLIFSGSRLPLKRCLMNLVSNAISHSKGRVLLGTRVRGEAIELQVIDNGIGIAASDRQKFLAPWRHGNQSAGHGLGLAIVQEICKEYRWRFDISSTPGKGSCFSVIVPRTLADA